MPTNADATSSDTDPLECPLMLYTCLDMKFLDASVPESYSNRLSFVSDLCSLGLTVNESILDLVTLNNHIRNLSRWIFFVNLVHRNTDLNLSCDSDYIYFIFWLISWRESASFVLQCCSNSIQAIVVGLFFKSKNLKHSIGFI